MTEFNKYLKEARQDFCKEVNKYNVSDNLRLRNACDSFLIAFDQSSKQLLPQDPMINYCVVYKKDSKKNFEKEFKTQGEMLDFIMLLDDGDLANYKVFEQLI